MVEINTQSASVMSAATKDFEEFLKYFDDMSHGMQDFQISLNQGWNELSVATEKHWSRINGNVENLDSAIGEVLMV